MSNAQWFLRIGVVAWFAGNAAIGRKLSAGDPFLLFWTFGCYLVPLAIAEAYMRAKDSASATIRTATAIFLAVVTLMMLVGIAGFGALSRSIVTGAPLALPG